MIALCNCFDPMSMFIAEVIEIGRRHQLAQLREQTSLTFEVSFFLG